MKRRVWQGISLQLGSAIQPFDHCWRQAGTVGRRDSVKNDVEGSGCGSSARMAEPIAGSTDILGIARSEEINAQSDVFGPCSLDYCLMW
jgi:hypothetical protein